MKILVCGSRGFNNKGLLKKYLDFYFKDDDTLISGGAVGADTLAEYYAANRKLKMDIFHPEWDKYGTSAGFIRNETMVEQNPDLVIAFWDGKSRGTDNTMSHARKKKIPTLIVYF